MSELVKELNQDNFQSEISSGTVLVDFWAPWCGPCKMMIPVLDELAKELGSKAKICKVNVDDYASLAAQYGVSSIPAIFIFKDGDIIASHTGTATSSALKEKMGL